MNNTTDIAIYWNALAKFPKDFCEKNPNKVFYGMMTIIALPYIDKALRQIGDDFRYWVDAKYGNPKNMVIDSE